MSIPVSQLSHLPLPPWCPYIVLYVCDSISALQIGAAFLDSTYMVICNFFFLSYFPLYDSLEVYLHLSKLHNFIPFLWLSNVLLSMCATSLSIPLLMDISWLWFVFPQRLIMLNMFSRVICISSLEKCLLSLNEISCSLASVFHSPIF